MNNFRELRVWQRAVDLATKIYEKTKTLPKTERYGLTSQMRRCSVSISSNIAEGAGRRSNKEFKHFLDVATGSCYELETQLIISKNLDYLKEESFKSLKAELIKIEKMIYNLIASIAD